MKLIRDKFLSGEIYTLSVKEIDKFFEDNSDGIVVKSKTIIHSPR